MVQKIVDPAKEVVASARIFQAVKDNQLLTAAILFILWQMDLFNSVIGYGCGLSWQINMVKCFVVRKESIVGDW